ncbi:ATPase [groundwater metagenome]
MLSRLNGGKGDPVIQLQTPFGGGKTHALLALYHAVENREKVKHLDFISKLPKPKNAKVVVFVGTYPDPIKGRTPWGEIANQLGVREGSEVYYKQEFSPTMDSVILRGEAAKKMKETEAKREEKKDEPWDWKREKRK